MDNTRNKTLKQLTEDMNNRRIDIISTNSNDAMIIESIEFWRDRIIQSCGLPSKLTIISTRYNIASGTSETEQITWSRRLLPGDSYYYPDAYTPERVEHWRSQIGDSWDSSHAIGCDFAEETEQQVEQAWNHNIKSSCKYYSNNPYLKCAVDPCLNCGDCPHYEYLDPTI